MFKFLFIFLLIYLGFRIFRAFFKGLFVITQQKQGENPYIQRGGIREKDISDRARILEDDKNAE